MKIVRLLILTCISVFFGAASVFADTCSFNVMYCNDAKLCERAIVYTKGAATWHSSVSRHVLEAKQRGLSCGVKETVVASKPKKYCALDASACIDNQLCKFATNASTGRRIWTQTPRWLGHGTEAKRRGLTCGVEGANNSPDTTALDALRAQLVKANAELANTKQKLADAEQDKADLNARLTVAVLDHNEFSTIKQSKHNAELATLTEQYETESAATLEKIEKLQTELSALETDASEALAKVTELTNQLVESRANVSTSSAAKLKAEKQISQAESAALAAEQELAEFKIANDQTDLKQQLAAALARIKELELNGSDTVDVVEDTNQTIDPAKNVLVDIASLSREEQRELQTALKEAGVYGGAIDGIMGKGSMRAIQSWQEARGYEASGELTVGQSDELLLGEEVVTSAEVLAAVEVAEPEGSQSITSVMIQIARPTFDVFNCAFNLEFTNSETGGSFDVVMFADDGSGKFTATTKDIQKALIKNGLTADDNDWSQLTIEATKYDDPSVGCKPLFQRSYEIKDEGPENTFKVDSDGQLTMIGLPLASTNASGTEEVAEQVFSQTITSVIAQVTNPTFDVAKCTFNLKFTDGISGMSFNVKMDPEGGTGGKFTAGRNDIEDGLADAGLAAAAAQWAFLTVKVKKFDYPFVSCQPANQDFHFISKDEADGNFKVDQNGQLSITGLPVVAVVDSVDAESSQPELELSKEISTIKYQTSNRNIDLYACGFSLLFTSRESGAKFEIMMFYEGDGSFTSAETINDKLAQKALALNNNNWQHLTVQAKKLQIEGVSCEPAESEPALITRKGSSGRFTISRDGVLNVNDVKLVPALDDLLVFVSKNIGLINESSGMTSFDPNYPFASNLSLQDFYFTHALDALQRYAQKPDATFSGIKIYTAEKNGFVERANISLPNRNVIIDNKTIFGDQNINLRHMMPDVARVLRKNQVANDTGILVIGSFGLANRDLCDNSMYNKITRSRSNASVTILNFIPFENFSALNYKTVQRAPVTLQCPDRDDVLLIFPNEVGRYTPQKIVDGFYKLISKGVEQ